MNTSSNRSEGISIDLHGYHPHTMDELIPKLVRESQEMGCIELTLIHGHALGRWAVSRPFANTNTGYLGLTVRRILRTKILRQWMYTKIDVSDPGVTTIRLRPNLKPSRADFDPLPDFDFDR